MKNYGTMDKTMVHGQNYGTILRTMELPFTKKNMVDYQKLKDFDL